MVYCFYVPNRKTEVFKRARSFLTYQVARPQSSKKPHTLQTTKLEPILYTGIYIDFKRPIVQSNCYKLLLGILDATTRYAITVPLQAVTVEILSDALIQRLFIKHGILQIISLDQASMNKSTLIRELCSHIGTHLVFSLAEANLEIGVIEIFHLTLFRFLKSRTIK